MSAEEGGAEIIARARAGDGEAFAAIVKQYRNRLFGLAMAMVKNRDAAEDVVQETFVKAYKNINKFRGDSTVYTWLYRITVNTAHNYLRRRREGTVDLEEVAPILEATDPGPAALAYASEVGAAIEKAVASLPERQREVFLFHYFEQLTHREIARVLGITEGAVKAHYFHAIQKLKTALLPFAD